MTLRVYTVRDGVVVSRRPEVRVTTNTLPPPELWSAFPPCRCPRCRSGQGPKPHRL